MGRSRDSGSLTIGVFIGSTDYRRELTSWPQVGLEASRVLIFPAPTKLTRRLTHRLQRARRQEKSSCAQVKKRLMSTFATAASQGLRLAATLVIQGLLLNLPGFNITLSSINSGAHQENLSSYQTVTGQGFAVYGIADGDYLITGQSYLRR